MLKLLFPSTLIQRFSREKMSNGHVSLTIRRHGLDTCISMAPPSFEFQMAHLHVRCGKGKCDPSAIQLRHHIFTWRCLCKTFLPSTTFKFARLLVLQSRHSEINTNCICSVHGSHHWLQLMKSPSCLMILFAPSSYCTSMPQDAYIISTPCFCSIIQ